MSKNGRLLLSVRDVNRVLRVSPANIHDRIARVKSTRYTTQPIGSNNYRSGVVTPEADIGAPKVLEEMVLLSLVARIKLLAEKGVKLKIHHLSIKKSSINWCSLGGGGEVIKTPPLTLRTGKCS